MRTASGSSAAVSPPDSIHGRRHLLPGDQVPIEGEPVAAGQRIDAARRLCIEQQHVGICFVARGGEHVFRRGDGDHLHHRAMEAQLRIGNPVRAFPAVELEDVDRRHVEDGADRIILGVDKEADPLHAGRHRRRTARRRAPG